MKALVTGANGFLGSHLVDELLDDGKWDIRVLVRPNSDLRWLQGKPLEKVYGDVTFEADELNSAVRGADVVFHVAGLTKALSKKDYWEVNAGGTENLLKACLAVGDPSMKFVFVSSAGAQGPAGRHSLCSERDTPKPVTEYGRSKLAAETIVQKYKDRIDCRILRPGGIYGPRDMELLPAFRILQSGIMIRLGMRERMISMAHARDITRAVLAAACSDVDSGEVFLVGGENASQSQLLENMALAVDVKPILNIALPSPLVVFAAGLSSLMGAIFKRPRIFSLGTCSRILAFSWALDLSKAQTQLNYKPHWDLRAGLAQTAQWYRSVGLL